MGRGGGGGGGGVLITDKVKVTTLSSKVFLVVNIYIYEYMNIDKKGEHFLSTVRGCSLICLMKERVNVII